MISDFPRVSRDGAWREYDDVSNATCIAKQKHSNSSSIKIRATLGRRGQGAVAKRNSSKTANREIAVESRPSNIRATAFKPRREPRAMPRNSRSGIRGTSSAE